MIAGYFQFGRAQWRGRTRRHFTWHRRFISSRYLHGQCLTVSYAANLDYSPVNTDIGVTQTIRKPRAWLALYVSCLEFCATNAADCVAGPHEKITAGHQGGND